MTHLVSIHGVCRLVGGLQVRWTQTSKPEQARPARILLSDWEHVHSGELSRHQAPLRVWSFAPGMNLDGAFA